MKRRLNILCVVVLLVLGWSVGKSLYYMYIGIEMGVEKGLEMARNAESVEELERSKDFEALTNITTVGLAPRAITEKVGTLM